MASRKRLASWSTALSEEREAREEAEDEQLAVEWLVDELQDQIAEVEAEREGLESQLAAVGAEREARAETERDLEEALEQLQTTEELTASLQAELEALRGGESARSRAPPSAGAWPRCRRCGWHPVADPELPGAAPTPTTRCAFCWAHMPAGCTHCGECGMQEVGGEAEPIPAELRKTVAFLHLVIVCFFECSHLLLLAPSLPRRCSSRGGARGRPLRLRAWRVAPPRSSRARCRPSLLGCAARALRRLRR